jgi:hypothetical protein
MKTANMVELSQPNGFYPIDRYIPYGWEADFVVHAELDVAVNGKTIEFVLKQAPYASQAKTLEQRLTAIGAGTPDTSFDPWPDTSVGKYPSKPLDLDIRRPSFVILELCKATNWQFRTDGPAVTTKQFIPGGNGGLRHVTFNSGKPVLDFNAPGNDCRVVCFAVLQREAYDMHGMNLHVEFVQPGPHAIDVIIDPDVGNNGGSIYPPFQNI